LQEKMMVAYDSRRPPTPLSDGTREVLRAAIAEALAAPGEGTPALREGLRIAAREAQERQMRPEELIIELKGLFSVVLQGRTGTFTGDENRLREWLVTSCLKAYYEPMA
jgi:hypothetical protein